MFAKFRLSRAVSFSFAWLLLVLPVQAQVKRNVSELEGVDVVEHLDVELPLDATFKDDAGKQVKLRDYFHNDRPVILSLNYSNCPMLCNLQLNGLVEALQQIDLRPGSDFEILSVSIDPLESPIRARQTKQQYLRQYGRSGTGSGWHFLTGHESEITRLASTVGFLYRYIPERNEYAHAAVFMICTPEGRVSRYLYGVSFEPQTMRLSLVEAAAGKIGTPMDQVLLFCFQYDAVAGSYGPTAIGLMKLGGGVTVFVLAIVLFPTWLRRYQKRSKTSDNPRQVLPTAAEN
jgi:protein SCO1/2